MPTAITYCSVPDCSDRCHGRGLCSRHYKRLRKHGDVQTVKRMYRGPDHCAIASCVCLGPFKRGMCALHYQRWLKHGDALHEAAPTYRYGPEHHAWVGNDAAYRTVHHRLSEQRGRAQNYPCAICRRSADQWAYDHADTNERIGVVHDGIEVPYSVDLDHYIPLCHACHRRLDLRWLPIAKAG